MEYPIPALRLTSIHYRNDSCFHYQGNQGYEVHFE